MKKRVIGNDGVLLCEHYYIAGGHVYEFPLGRGKKRAVVALRETPRGDGEVLWEENGGIQKYLEFLERSE